MQIMMMRTRATDTPRCTANPAHTPAIQGAGMSGLAAVARTSEGLAGGAGMGGVQPGCGDCSGLLTIPLWHVPGAFSGLPPEQSGAVQGVPYFRDDPSFWLSSGIDPRRVDPIERKCMMSWPNGTTDPGAQYQQRPPRNSFFDAVS